MGFLIQRPKNSVLRKEFKKYLLFCKKIIKRTTIPILSTVKLEVKGNKLIINASNLEVFEIFSIDYFGDEFFVCLPIKELLSRIKMSNQEYVIFEIGEEIKVDGVILMQESIDRFICTPENKDYKIIDSFFENIDKVSFCCSVDENRFVLTGVLLKNRLMVATDGHRMGVVRINTEIENEIIIPSKFIFRVKEIMKKERRVLFGIKNGYLFLKTDNKEIIIKLIEGEFVNYELFIIKEWSINIELNLNDVLIIVSKLSLLSDQIGLLMKIIFNKNKIEFFVFNEEKEYKEEIELNDGLYFLEIKINFNYLFEMLRVIKKNIGLFNENIIMKVKDNVSPLLFEYGDDKWVIMPIRPDKER